MENRIYHPSDIYRELESHPSGHEPAHQRVPTEIWGEIFSIAIDSPLIPYKNDDIVDIHLLFTQDFASQSIHRRTEGIRTHLRLVCRAWNAFLSNKGVKVVTRSDSVGIYHRLEDLHFTPFGAGLGVGLEDGSACCPIPLLSMQSLRIGIVCAKYSIDSLLQAPRLQALHIRCCVPRSTTADNFLTHPITLTLVHLQLSTLSLHSLEEIIGPVSFPRLRCLSLQLTGEGFVTRRLSTDSDISLGASLSAWCLPKLQTLKLQGILGAIYEPEINQFLSKTWHGVTSLYIDLTYEAQLGDRGVFVITPNLWASFPNLRTFGTHAASLSEAPVGPPPTRQRFSLVLEFMWSTRNSGFSLRGQSMIPFLQVLDEWKPMEIIFLSSWGEIYQGWKSGSGTTVSMWPKGFFLTALERYIRLLDVNRMPMCEDDGLRCLEFIYG